MPRLPHDRPAAVARDVVVHPLRAFHVADNRRAGTLAQNRARERHHQLVAPHDLSVLVHRTDAVGVAVVRDPDRRVIFFHRRDQVAHVLLDRRVRMMVGEAPVHLGVEFDRLEPEPFHQRRRDHPAASVAAVHDDLESRRELELRHDEIVVVGNHRALGERALRAGRDKIAPLDYFAQPLNLRAVNRRRSHAQLEAVVLGRVMTAGDHHAAVHLPAQHRKIKQRRRHHADVDHVDARAEQALGQPIAQAVRRQPAIAAERDRFFPRAMQQRCVAAPEIDHERVVEIVRDDAADVVLAEDLRIHYRQSVRANRSVQDVCAQAGCQ